jgi:hypothetical protein
MTTYDMESAQLCYLIINKLLKFGSKIIVMQCALHPQDYLATSLVFVLSNSHIGECVRGIPGRLKMFAAIVKICRNSSKHHGFRVILWSLNKLHTNHGVSL